jgi:hypothetical protein
MLVDHARRPTLVVGDRRTFVVRSVALGVLACSTLSGLI